eukprot:scaffold4569_cov284-Chaetoceros_neogracile.AAC.15
MTRNYDDHAGGSFSLCDYLKQEGRLAHGGVLPVWVTDWNRNGGWLVDRLHVPFQYFLLWLMWFNESLSDPWHDIVSLYGECDATIREGKIESAHEEYKAMMELEEDTPTSAKNTQFN